MESKRFETPILFISFNRPIHTRRVLETIMAEKPKELFIFQDGAREGNTSDVEKCENVRQVIRELTDNARLSLHTFFSQENLGCGPGPAAAITWFFENADQGIIIEDDAVPHPDFFIFAAELLKKYANNKSVMAIGSMKLGNKRYGDGSYYFSKMNHTLCAWATWRRAWQRFDYSLQDFSIQELDQCLRFYGAHLREREYWIERLKEIHRDALHDSSWDQQFWMSIWRNRGKGILPNANLSTNIGFDENGTHTVDSSSPASNIALESILPIIHPSTEVIQRKADLDFQKHFFQAADYGWKGFVRLPFRLNWRLKRLIGHEGSWFKKAKKDVK